MKLVKLDFKSLNIIDEKIYSLTLKQHKGKKTFSMIIGSFEAYSIGVIFEKKLKDKRPLIYDLFKDVLSSIDVEIKKAVVYKLDNDIFFSNLYFKVANKSIVLESRASDSIIMALRYSAPIYINKDIFDDLIDENMIQYDKSLSKQIYDFIDVDNSNTKDRSEIIIKELEKLIKKYINMDDYKSASRLRDQIVRIKNLNQRNNIS